MNSLKIIDSIGPFFTVKPEGRVNWSEPPFGHLEQCMDARTRRKITYQFRKFLNTVQKLGYDTVTLDDLAHLVPHQSYPASVQPILEEFSKLYTSLLTEAAKRKIGVIINTDLMFKIPGTKISPKRLLMETCAAALQLPIVGISMRLGECDGEDLEGIFRSQLYVKTPKQANALLRELLPMFEQTGKDLIIRTWTVGAYKIGDLIYNKATYEKVFHGIVSPNLVISMKYGNTDFFRMEKVNPLLKHDGHRKILELQARREREGFGRFPCYVGFEYENYFKQLQGERLDGIMVWCQTGGWSTTSDITFLNNSSRWNELNTGACIELFNGKSAQKVLKEQLPTYATFVQRYTELFIALVYVDGFADKELFVRRFRIPPVLWLMWDTIIISPLVRSFHDLFPPGKLPSEEDIIEVEKLGKRLPDKKFYIDTLRLLRACRLALRGEMDGFDTMAAAYEQTYPGIFTVELSGTETTRLTRFLLKVIIRHQSDMRFGDKVMNPILPLLARMLIRWNRKHLPSFKDKQSMPLMTIFK